MGLNGRLRNFHQEKREELSHARPKKALSYPGETPWQGTRFHWAGRARHEEEWAGGRGL